MNPSTQGITPLRQRMIDDMRMRRLSPKTQAGYIRIVRQFAAYLGRSPDTATVEDLRRYQLHLVDQPLRQRPSLRCTQTWESFDSPSISAVIQTPIA